MSTTDALQTDSEPDRRQSPLAPLREQLARVRRRRRAIRFAAGVIAIAVALLWVLSVIFLLDWQLSMSRLQRIVVILLGAGAMSWAYRKYAAALLAVHETDLDIALMVEKQQQIDSDLVAALQFETPEAAKWGSRQLSRAVIAYVADFSRDADLLERLSHEHVARRGVLMVVTFVALAAAIVWQPRYAATFLNRLALGSWHYPTRTSIDQVSVNSDSIVEAGQIVRCGFGQPVEFAVRASGDIATALHRIEAIVVQSGEKRSIELVAIDRKRDTAANGAAAVNFYCAALPALVDSLQFQVFVGDAWTDPALLEVIPLPVVETHLIVTPPQYARKSAAASGAATGSQQMSVLEGSQIGLVIACLNKRLSAATIEIGTAKVALTPLDSSGRNWGLSAANSPLASVVKPLQFRVQVTDEDGLHLPQPIEGRIEIMADKPPTITAYADVRLFLPTGQPEIRYSVDDDYGISAVRAIAKVQREQAKATPAGQLNFDVLSLPRDKPLLRPRIPYSGILRLPLSSLGALKGDKVAITLEATDFRGDEPHKTTASEPIVLQITDEAGIMAALVDSDKRAADQMDVLIQRQTEVGGLK